MFSLLTDKRKIMRLTKNELKIITNYLEFDNHIPNLDSEDRIKLLNRFRTELPVNELNIHLVSVAKHPLPRPMEAWNEAQKLDLPDYIDWHLAQEKRGNER